MRKIRCFLTILCLSVGLLAGMSASAEESYVYDRAELMSEAERLELHAMAMKLSDDWETNFVAATTDDTQGKTTQEYADDFYDELFQEDDEEDGILYLIDMEHREIYVSTSGLAIRYLTDERIEWVLDEIYPHVVDGDYYMAFVEGMSRTRDFLREGIPRDQYHYDVETGEIDAYKEPMKLTVGEVLLALFAGLIPAAVTIGIIKAKYQLKFEDFHYDAYTDSDIRLSVKSDRLVNTFVTHRRIPRNNGNSGGGRSSGGGSRSSVHTSSSGRSHGGGGRKF